MRRPPSSTPAPSVARFIFFRRPAQRVHQALSGHLLLADAAPHAVRVRAEQPVLHRFIAPAVAVPVELPPHDVPVEIKRLFDVVYWDIEVNYLPRHAKLCLSV